MPPRLCMFAAGYFQSEGRVRGGRRWKRRPGKLACRLPNMENASSEPPLPFKFRFENRIVGDPSIATNPILICHFKQLGMNGHKRALK